MYVLYEYESTDLDITRRQAWSLSKSDFVDVEPAHGDRWRVTARAFVGSLIVDGLQLLIRPKINPDNLFLLLEPGLPTSAWRQEAFEYNVTSDLLQSMIAFFARTAETTLERGVYRSYEARSEVLTAMRGRLDIPAQLSRAGVLTSVACSYDEYSDDVLENRILRAAVRKSLMVPGVDQSERHRLMRVLASLEGVSDTPISSESVSLVHFTRLNEHYKPALGLARLILSNLTLTDSYGSVAASSFMVDMNDLFQRFVTQRLRQSLRHRLEVVDEPKVHLGENRQVSMFPDLEFRDVKYRTVYVGDIKYKLTDDAQGRSSDYYQLLAYTTALDLEEGILIYCKKGGERTSRTVTVKNNRKRLVLHSVDLSGTPKQVDAEIKFLADSIAKHIC